MSIPSILNSKLFHAQFAWKAIEPKFHGLGHCTDKMTRTRMCYEIAEGSNTIRGKQIASPRGKFTLAGKECLKLLLKEFNLGNTATWSDLFQKALERKITRLKAR